MSAPRHNPSLAKSAIAALTLLMVVSLAWQSPADLKRDWAPSGSHHGVSQNRLPAPQTYATQHIRRVSRERFTGVVLPKRAVVLASRLNERVMPSCEMASPDTLIELHLDLPPPALLS